MLFSKYVEHKVTWICRSCHPEVFCKKSFLGNFVKFTEKHLCQNFFLNKVADWGLTLLKRDSGTNVFLWNFWEHIFLHNTSGGCFWIWPCTLLVGLRWNMFPNLNKKIVVGTSNWEASYTYCSINCRRVFRTLSNITAKFFLKIMKGYKGEFKTMSNIWDGAFSAGSYELQRWIQILAKHLRSIVLRK